MKFAIALAVLTASIAARNRYVNSIVPEPYLDEVFHIPQAQAYCRDEFATWDPKLTTPAGLYLLSYPLSYLAACNIPALRAVNGIGVALVIPTLVYRIRQTLFGKPPSSSSAAAHTALNIALFPLLYFFSGLYYTDVWSTVFVLAAYLACIRKQHVISAVFCWVSLWFRQTNILWTIFMAGLSAVSVLTIDDPPLNSASYSHLLRTPLSILLSLSPAILRPLLPYIAVLTSFLSFLHWNNNTIVLGDASAHTASLHLPQILYFFAALSFFSFPLLLRFIPSIPLLPALAAIPVAAVAVKWNTVLHPYLLADNRHYTFYVFRRILLRAPPYSLLAPVPAYYTACALSILALRGPGEQASGVGGPRGARASASASSSASSSSGVRISWLLLWTCSTVLSLISAPLVEPRYFLVAWVLWRLHVQPNAAERWAETLWFVLVNGGTTWVFVNWGFQWPADGEGVGGGVQRFMW